MSSLLPAVLKTLQPRLVDPKNEKLFLPEVLSGIDGSNSQGKLLPLEEKYWDLGPIKGDSGTNISNHILDQWSTFLEMIQEADFNKQKAIRDPRPGHSDPTLALGNNDKKKKEIVVHGLANVFVDPDIQCTPMNGKTGYQVKATLVCDYWDGKEGRPKYGKLTVQGPYLLHQEVCTADKADLTKCNGNYADDVNAHGNVTIEIPGAVLDADVEVTVAENPRALSADVKSLKLRGKNPGSLPGLDIPKGGLTITDSPFSDTGAGDTWLGIARTALTSEDGRRGLFSSVEAALNQPSNLRSLSETLTDKLGESLDGVLGKPAGTVAAVQSATATDNPVDRYLFDRMRHALNDPKSAAFLPKILNQNKDPSLEPLQVDEISIPTFKELGTKFENGSLTGLSFRGLSNVKAPEDKLTMSVGEVKFTATLGGWNPPPSISGGTIPAPPATGSSDFSIESLGTLFKGTIDLTVEGAEVVSDLQTDGTSDSDLTVTFNSLKIVATTDQVKIGLKMKTFARKKIEEKLNTSDTLSMILGKINDEIQGKLSDISSQVTQYARQAISSGLK